MAAKKSGSGAGGMLSKDVEIAIRVALNDAHRRGHEIATVEHLTWALLHDDETANVLRHCGADIAKLKGDFDKFLDEQIEKVERRPRDPALARLPARGAAGHHARHGRGQGGGEGL